MWCLTVGLLAAAATGRAGAACCDPVSFINDTALNGQVGTCALCPDG